MSQLNTLVNHRKAILLAEAIGWLHNYRKCSHDPNQRPSRAQLAQVFANQGFSSILSNPNLLEFHFSTSCIEREKLEILLDDKQHLSDEKLKPGQNSASLLLQFLSRCHNTPHFDKQEPTGGEQRHSDVKISSPFGFEQGVPNDLTSRLWTLPWITLANYCISDRANLIDSVSKLFTQVGADTRRPINEISLWDWGTLVGALYKATIAGALLSGQIPQVRDLRWRLLSIRFDGLDYITQAARLPDLLGREQLLTDALNKVRDLLEEEYPVGNEVYRDENGSLFVVPDLQNLLSFTDNNGRTLHALILQAFKQGTLRNDRKLALGGEITPVVEIDKTAWWGQDPNWQTRNPPQNEIPPVGKILSQSITSPPSPEDVQQFWQNNVADICTVCGLRPQAKIDSLSSRKVCETCERRRLGRCQSWATKQLEETIWIDEVSDTNARLALITGQFDLDDWLSGQLVESLVLNLPGSGSGGVVKNPSFSRIRRVWETNRQFWQAVKADFKHSLTDSRQRLLLYLDQVPNLAPFHVYELDLGATTLSVAWYPIQDDGSGGYLISTDNLGYVARQLKAEKGIFTDPAAAAIFVEDYVKSEFATKKRSLKLRSSDALVGERNQNLLKDRCIVKTDHQDVAYSTAIPILAEPRTFMALVPADKSLEVIEAIKTKYEREMGKVRNRLPLHLGVVYFQRRTPLRSALDAGRQMLTYKSPDDKQLWQVQSTSKGQLPNEKKDLANGTKQFDETITLSLTQDDRTITWHVPNRMGDGNTPDVWYPYVFLETGDDNNKLNGRWVYKSQRPGETAPCWLVHTADLKEGDQIYFTPSTFDFEFLDSTARRFEIYYDENGRRPRCTRPFDLEDLDRFDTLWKILKNLETSQRHQVIYAIEATRETWHGQDEQASLTDPVFKQFVTDTLANATWAKGYKKWTDIPPEARQQMIEAGVRGELADLAELHMEILKER